MSRRAVSARSVTPALLARMPLPSSEGIEGKESRGRVLAVGGSSSVPGALLLAGTAALRVGAGKLQMATVAGAAVPLGLHMPEAMVLGLPAGADGELRAGNARVMSSAKDTDALLVGPGMRNGANATRLAAALLRNTQAPVVLDAGALAASASRNIGDTARIVVTPHAGEMAGQLDIALHEVTEDAARVAREFAQVRGVVTVLKGATTWIAAPDGRLWVHTGGCIGLGTSGSGDVLAGAIAGLIARGAEPVQAAIWAVYLHGKAGLRLARQHGALGFLAREIADAFPHVMPGRAAKPRTRR